MLNLDSIVKVTGDKEDTKNDPRNFLKAQFIQIHQTDYWPGEKCSSMKTNLYVSKQAVYEVHNHDTVIDGNYSDFYHIETAWVSASRKTVEEKGVTFHREAGVWSEAREALLETAIVYAVLGFRAKKVEPTIITHRQSYKNRVIDPDPEIAQAAYRIALKHGFKLNFDWVRGSGRSADLWYPPGCKALL